MQYVRNISDSVSTAWNSINPATLSGAIDVIVVEQEDGSLVCSPFHVRFGKFSLLRPYEKKVEFKVNGVAQDYSMKLGEGGEAFFVFETTETIPQSQQTSPISSPASSPTFPPQSSSEPNLLQEPDPLDLDNTDSTRSRRTSAAVLPSSFGQTELTDASEALAAAARRKSMSLSSTFSRSYSDDLLRKTTIHPSGPPSSTDEDGKGDGEGEGLRSQSPPPLAPHEAFERGMALSAELQAAGVPSHVTDTGDVKLDMSNFKNNEEDIFRAEILARKVLSDELEGNYDIGALIGVDENGNLWIYSSEEAKQAAMKKTMESALHRSGAPVAADAASDPGYQSDNSDVTTSLQAPSHRRAESDIGPMQLHPSSRTATGTPKYSATAGDPNRNYAKTLRLTSDQLKALKLTPGENSMSFTVNRATCQAYMYLWKHETPVVISDIDGTITKSDALGHVLNMIGRDWTHSGVAKLYSDIAMNGFNIMYLTSRSVGQSDTTRAYLYGITQDGCRLPRGPTILSPDRTMAALRREIYLRKPHVFKMATLRDIRSLYGPDHKPFYAGFGNRFTDQISYRTVDVPRNRIFTINSNAEVSLDLLSLNKLKLSYININEVVDHFFPPVSTLVKGGGEEFTDFTYWREPILDFDDFTASETDEGAEDDVGSAYGDEDDGDGDELDDEIDEANDRLADSYMSQNSMGESILSGEADEMMDSIIEDEYADDEDDGEGASEDEGEDDVAATPEPEKASPVKTRIVQDLAAEAVTGVKHLTMEKKEVPLNN